MSNRLPILADAANASHEYTKIALRAAAEAARDAGIVLLEAKELVPHGEWAAWIKANFKAGIRTAQRYMRIANNWPTIEGKATSVSHLSVNEALGILDGRDDLEKALVLQAETDALQQELYVLKAAVEQADEAMLRFIITRCQDIHDQLVVIKGTAIKEAGRLVKELESHA